MRCLHLALLALLLPIAARADDDEKTRKIVEQQIANRKGKIEAMLALLAEPGGDDVEVRLDVARACLELNELGCHELGDEHVIDLARDQVWRILSADREHAVARQLLTLLENHTLSLAGEGDTAAAGRAYQDGRYEEAIRLANSERADRPVSASLDLLQASSHFLLWEFEDARRHAASGRGKEPTNAQLVRLLAKCDEREGEFAKATAGYVTALALDPGYEAAWQDLSWVVRHDGRRVRRVHLARRADLREGPDGKLSIVVESGERNPIMNSWLGYAATRARWRKEIYAERHPGEPYRHTYAEELDAWTKVAQIWDYYKKEDPAPVDADLDRLADLENHLKAFVYVEAWQPTFAGVLDSEGGPTRSKVERYLTEVVVGR